MQGRESIPAVSVVIPCSRRQVVGRCLDGFEQQSGHYMFEIIVVGDVRGVARHAERFTLVLVPFDDPHTNARRNRGIAAARADRIAFMDDDAIPSAGWISAAAAVDPAGCTIVTGPEQPYGATRTAGILAAVTSNRLAEGTRAHVSTAAMPVAWPDVPFCNCVVPRWLFEVVGLPATDAPWDMDDFEFCHRARTVARFENDPRLSIRHDRYPDSTASFLRYKWRARVRTGEKLISHARLYSAIPAVVICAASPWLVALCWALAGGSIAAAALIGAGYAALVFGLAVPSARQFGALGMVQHAMTLAALHAVTVAGVQVGIVKRLVGR